MDSKPDLRKTESIKAICKNCGKGFELIIRCDRDGNQFGINQTLCFDCRQKERNDLILKQMQEKLPKMIEDQKDKWAIECNVSGFFIDKAAEGFEKFERKLQPKAFDACKNFNGKSIILSSPELYGVGKTHLVSCLAWNLIDTTEAVSISPDGNYRKYKCPVFFTSENQLLARIRNTYNRHPEEQYAENEEDIYDKLSNYHVLIIDDVGKVRPKDYSFLQGVYFRIIDERYIQEKTIILTTNLSLTDLEAHIGGACADRLKDMCGPENIIKMTGKSYRGNRTP